jgi:ferredoxin
MADSDDKWEDNIPGFSIIKEKKVSFYVDKECILCSVCSDEAPENFRMSDEEDHDICFKQPESEEELEQCYEALEGCPVDAIGDDGHE